MGVYNKRSKGGKQQEVNFDLQDWELSTTHQEAHKEAGRQMMSNRTNSYWKQEKVIFITHNVRTPPTIYLAAKKHEINKRWPKINKKLSYGYGSSFSCHPTQKSRAQVLVVVLTFPCEIMMISIDIFAFVGITLLFKANRWQTVIACPFPVLPSSLRSPRKQPLSSQQWALLSCSPLYDAVIRCSPWPSMLSVNMINFHS